MKKVAAFLTAVVLFCVTAASIHFFAGSRIEANNREFGTWINSKKDLSYNAVAANLHNDTYLMMGSSEFQHGNNTPYHPTAIFNQANMDVMCIGAAGNQCLPHAIAMGALAPDLKSKKVVLLLSPTWFGKNGIEGNEFSARFSESMYAAMLKNESLSDDLKQKLIDRTTKLLEVSPLMKANVDRATKVLTGDRLNNGQTQKTSLEDKVNYYIHSWIAQEKEKIGVGMMWKVSGHKNNRTYEPQNAKEPDWDALKKQAEQEVEKEFNNDLCMRDTLYNTKYKPILKERKDTETKRSFEKSPEYDDLKLFLDICKDQGIEVKLILLPINGYWYDHTGFPRKNRDVIVEKIHKIADDYGVELSDLYGEGYTKGWLEDNTHPAGKGWIEINEKVYEFFNKDKEVN